jgi:hypothetical protein
VGARKSIDLGDGLRRQVSYDELRSLLKKNNVDARRAQRILGDNFPDENAADLSADRDAKLLTINGRRWDGYLGVTPPDPSLVPYRVSHEDLLKRISRSRLNPPEDQPRNRVTDFTGWIYEVIHGPPDPALLAAGKVGEREIAKIKRCVPHLDWHSDWQLIDADPLNEKPEAREISLLKVGNDSLYGAPDYVFQNKKNGTIIIVEMKVSNATLHSDGWPNLRAQLWAYGCIDRYVESATNIILIGEIWGRTYNTSSGEKGYRLKQHISWSMSDDKFCKQNEELFESYNNWVCNPKLAPP